VAVLNLNFDGGLTTEIVTSSQWKESPSIVSSNRSKSSLASLHTTFFFRTCVKKTMRMPHAKCSTKCIATMVAVVVAVDFWCNFCNVIFVVIFSASSPKLRRIWCNFCYSLNERLVISVALEKCPIMWLSYAKGCTQTIWKKNIQTECEAYWHIACLS